MCHQHGWVEASWVDVYSRRRYYMFNRWYLKWESWYLQVAFHCDLEANCPNLYIIQPEPCFVKDGLRESSWSRPDNKRRWLHRALPVILAEILRSRRHIHRVLLLFLYLVEYQVQSISAEWRIGHFQKYRDAYRRQLLYLHFLLLGH